MNWIKIRVDLDSHPKVIEMARKVEFLNGADPELSVTLRRVTRNGYRFLVVGCLCKIWSKLGAIGKREGDDLIVHEATLSTLDDLTGIDGIGEAMEYVGWVMCHNEEGTNRLILSNFFEEYNTDYEANYRAKNAERQKRFRAKKQHNVTDNVNSNATDNVNVTSHRNVRIDKNRNIYNARNELLANGINEKLADDWLAVRKAKKLPLTETALSAIKRESEKANLSLEQAIRISCENGWGGLKAEWVVKETVGQLANNQKNIPVADVLL